MRSKSLIMMLCMASAAVPLLAQKTKKLKTPAKPKDQIEVVGHVRLNSGVVKRFFPTKHYSSYYLYIEYESGDVVTLLDVTQARAPVVLADIPIARGGGAATLVAAAGTSGLVADNSHVSQPTTGPQTVRIMDFSNPNDPKVAREFAAVTAIQRDVQRGLVFLAADDGLWILHEYPATDPDIDKTYDDYLRYGISMYPPGK